MIDMGILMSRFVERSAQRLLPMILLWMGSAAAAWAQSPSPLPQPHLDLDMAGSAPFVRAVVRQHNGGLIVSGNFDSANGLPRQGLLRLNADGTLDPDWNPTVNGAVYDLAVDSSDAVFAMGYSAAVKLAGGGTGAMDAAWNPDPHYSWPLLYAIAIDTSDHVYIGGDHLLVRVSSSGAGVVDANWNPAPTGGDVSSIVFDAASGALYVGGGFTGIGGQALSHLARLGTGASATADVTWTPAVDYGVIAMALNGRGSVYVSGFFNTVDGVRNRVVKFSTANTGAIDPVWNAAIDAPGFSFLITGVAINTLGNVFVSGPLTSVGGVPRNGFAKLDGATGALDVHWDPMPNDAVYTAFVLPDDRVLLGGKYSVIGGQPRDGLAAFPNPDPIFFDGFE